MQTWYAIEGAGNDSNDDDEVKDAHVSSANADAGDDITKGSMLRYQSVTDVTSYFRGAVLGSVFEKLLNYGGDTSKNTLTKDDDEYHFVNECSKRVLEIDVEKTKVAKFIRDHYAVRFPELTMLCADSVSYARLVRAIGNDVDSLVSHIDVLLAHLPSQIVAAVIAASATTVGRVLNETELDSVNEACDEMLGLEEARNTINGYIQSRMPLICPNLCAFMGTGITSQLFAIAGSTTAMTKLSSEELAELGSQRGNDVGVRMKTAGFLINVDLVQCQPPELRMKALRLVASRVSQLASIDDNRRASNNAEGLKSRKEVIHKMLEWTDPLVQQLQSKLKGLSNKTYERHSRRRAADKAEADRLRRQAARIAKPSW